MLIGSYTRGLEPEPEMVNTGGSRAVKSNTGDLEATESNIGGSGSVGKSFVTSICRASPAANSKGMETASSVITSSALGNAHESQGIMLKRLKTNKRAMKMGLPTGSVVD